MGMKRRAFLFGGLAVAGGGVFALHWGHRGALAAGEALTGGGSGRGGSFTGWLRIGVDDSITLYVPTIDMGQGSHTALAQMLADELDADLAKVTVRQAPAEPAFADAFHGTREIEDIVVLPSFLKSTQDAAASFVARQINYQQSSGSNSIPGTGQYGMRMIGAAAREALVVTAAARLNVPVSELTAAQGIVSHAQSGRTLRYGALAEEAAERSLTIRPRLKERRAFRYIGQSVPR